MDILSAIIIGIVIGIFAKLLVPGDREISGFLVTSLWGMLGALAAGWASRAAGWVHPGQAVGLIVATCGAVAVLGLWATLVQRRW